MHTGNSRRDVGRGAPTQTRARGQVLSSQTSARAHATVQLLRARRPSPSSVRGHRSLVGQVSSGQTLSIPVHGIFSSPPTNLSLIVFGTGSPAAIFRSASSVIVLYLIVCGRKAGQMGARWAEEHHASGVRRGCAHLLGVVQALEVVVVKVLAFDVGRLVAGRALAVAHREREAAALRRPAPVT